MATPYAKLVSVNLQEVANSPAYNSLIVRDAAGAPIDISTGYTAAMTVQSQSSAVRGATIYAGTTFSFGSDGTLGMAQSGAQVAALPCSESMPLAVLITNDAFATSTVVGKGFLTVAQALN